MVQTVGLEPTAGNQRRERCVLYRLSYICIEGGARLSEPPANHVMAHRRFYVSRVLSVPEHTCSKESLMASLLGTSPCVRNYNIEA